METLATSDPLRTCEWVRISLPHATFGIACRGGVVVDAAPIARWTIGKSESYVARYYQRKGAICTRLS